MARAPRHVPRHGARYVDDRAARLAAGLALEVPRPSGPACTAVPDGVPAALVAGRAALVVGLTAGLWGAGTVAAHASTTAVVPANHVDAAAPGATAALAQVGRVDELAEAAPETGALPRTVAEAATPLDAGTATAAAVTVPAATRWDAGGDDVAVRVQTTVPRGVVQARKAATALLRTTAEPAASRGVARERRALERLVADLGRQTAPVGDEDAAMQVTVRLDDASGWTARLRAATDRLADARDAADAKALLDTSRWPSLAGVANGTLPASMLAAYPGNPSFQGYRPAVAAFTAMDAAFADRFGYHLTLVSGYRSFGQQVAVKATRGYLAAAPGSSNHGWGLAIDLDGDPGTFGTAAHDWLVANAGRWGWGHPQWAAAGAAKAEAWHFEFATGAAMEGPAVERPVAPGVTTVG